MDNQNSTAPNPVAVYNNAVATFQNGAEILQSNRDLAAKIIAAGQAILNKIQANGGVITPETDQLLNDFIVKAKGRVKEMNEARSPVTQMMTAIAKLYTAEENAPGEILRIMQEYRDAYTKQCVIEQQKKDDEARKKAAKGQEAVNIRTEYETRILSHLRTAKETEKNRLYQAFNTITLENFSDKEKSLKAYKPLIGPEVAHAYAFDWKPNYHTADEVATMISEVREKCCGEALASHQREISEATQSLIDRLPSKKTELEQIAEAGAKEREEMLAKQKEREAAEEAKRKEDEAAAALKQQQEIDAKAEADKTMVMFNQTVDAMPETAAPETRQGFEITVNNPAGWVMIFQSWFTAVGSKMELDKIGNTKLDAMKAFCEKDAHKTGTKIEHTGLTYNATFKAVNRAVKAEL